MPPVLLLHGLWMRGFALAMLHKRLIEAGFRVHRFDYLSVAASEERILDRLAERIERLGQGGPVHLVGHSLGGLLALRASHERLAVARIVCLGAPLRGSQAARRVAGWGQAGAVVLGHNRALLEHGFERWDEPGEVGVIAGRLPLGLGAVVGHLSGEHDGTVAVAETRLPGIADHCVVEVNHTGLLFSPEVASLTAAFLHTGHFH